MPSTWFGVAQSGTCDWTEIAIGVEKILRTLKRRQSWLRRTPKRASHCLYHIISTSLLQCSLREGRRLRVLAEGACAVRLYSVTPEANTGAWLGCWLSIISRRRSSARFKFSSDSPSTVSSCLSSKRFITVLDSCDQTVMMRSRRDLVVLI